MTLKCTRLTKSGKPDPKGYMLYCSISITFWKRKAIGKNNSVAAREEIREEKRQQERVLGGDGTILDCDGYMNMHLSKLIE